MRIAILDILRLILLLVVGCPSKSQLLGAKI